MTRHGKAKDESSEDRHPQARLKTAQPDADDKMSAKAEGEEMIETEVESASTAHRMFHLLLEVLDPLCMATTTAPLTTSEDAPGGGEALSNATLIEVSENQRREALETWNALSDLFDRLGVAQLAAVEEQTDLQQVPQEVIQAIELHLDDNRLTSIGKVLAIGRLLLGQSYPSQ